MMKSLLITLALLATPWAQAFSAPENEVKDPIKAEGEYTGFVALKKDREVFVRWTKAKPGQPTAILLNGLTYSTRQWDDFSQVLAAQGFGVLRYDMTGMGETLLKYAPILAEISYRDQVKDLNLLTQKLGITGKLNLVGLSYGGAIALAYAAAYPNDVKNVIVMAPFTRPLAEQDEWIKSQIWYTRRVVPFNPASDDELYDYYLRQVIYTTYPSVEPIVLENPFKLEGVFRMVQGVRKWTSDDAVNLLPKASVHLMIAGNDQYIKRRVMEDFWATVPQDRRASMIVVNNSEHKMPESVPFFAATWVGEILKKNPVLSSGREFDADPFAGSVRYEGGNLTFPREREGRGTIGRN